MVLRRFCRDTRGAVAMTMAISMVGIGAAVGAAIDYTRVTTARTQLQSAIDAAALRAGKSALATNGTKASQRRKEALDTFNAIYNQDKNPKVSSFTVTEGEDSLRVEALAEIPTLFGRLVGKSAVAITAAAEVPTGLNTLEVVLVLDNTGSMAALGKMTELKAAGLLFLDTIDAARNGGGLGAAPVAVVPFNTQVEISTSYRYSSFMRYDGVFSLDPKLRVTSSSWDGCVADRNKPYDVRLSAPNAGNSARDFPGAVCQYSGLQRVQPLTSDYSTLRTVINSMTPTGNTNTAIGMMWGYNVLTNGMPLGDTALAKNAKRNNKVMIFLTDGLNTEDRFGKVAADIDARMNSLCDAVKKDGIEIYTVRVIEGNEPMLKACASSPDNYFNITKSSDLKETFRKIAERLVVLRLSS